jgi:hypothetical protein
MTLLHDKSYNMPPIVLKIVKRYKKDSDRLEKRFQDIHYYLL